MIRHLQHEPRKQGLWKHGHWKQGLRKYWLWIFILGIGSPGQIAAQDADAQGPKEHPKTKPAELRGGLGAPQDKTDAGLTNPKKKIVTDQGAAPKEAGKIRSRESLNVPRDAEKKPKPPGTVLFLKMGTHRAAKILRLVGKLTGLEVRVEHKRINDLPLRIPRLMGKRPIGLEELTLFLIGQKIFLHEWNHPKKGRLIVVSRSPHWKPRNKGFQQTIEVSKRLFDSTWNIVEDEVRLRNEKLPESARHYAAVPVARLGKIYLWSPSKKGLEQIVAASARIEASDRGARFSVYTYVVKHRRVQALHEVLLDKLSAGEKKRTRISIVGLRNTLLYRTDADTASKIEAILKEVDQPGKRRRSTRFN